MRLVLVICFSITSVWLAAAERTVETHVLDGLEGPAEIRIDRWGVPHIYASTHYDAFFVQGFNAARDRLWQIDTWRRRGLGRLASVLGAKYAEQDRANRLFLYRGDMYREWLSYGSDAKAIASAFANGINAYIDLIEREPERLPPEFAVLGYSPERWHAEDVVRIRSHGLWRNVSSEVQRAELICRFGVEKALAWRKLEPAWPLVVPEGLDPCAIPSDVLDTYRLAKAAVVFDPEADGVATIPRDDLAGLGSNNWALAPERTASGNAILANDPHRGHAVPSLRYIAHLVAPGLNVIGAGEPGLPGVSIGHNERIAFGLTIFGLDHEDLYVYDLDPDDPTRYRYADEFEPVRRIAETIPVLGADPQDAVLEYTRHGPVIHRTDERLFAVRAAWLEPGMAPYFGSVEYMRAENWREFVAALNRWGAPAENQVYADVDGNIGHKPAGLFPRRLNHDGVLPVPGDGRYEWSGYHDMDALPETYNPASGFVATANEMNLPGDYPIAARRVGFDWSAPWRKRRIDSVLERADGHLLADSLALQTDTTSLFAAEVISRLPNAIPGAAKALFANWRGDMAAGSAPAALFGTWYYQHFLPAMAESEFGAEAGIRSLDLDFMLAAVADPRRAALIETTLVAALESLEETLGTDRKNWRWGDLHEIALRHPLEEHLTDADRQAWALPRFPRGGTGNSPNAAHFDRDDLDVRAGASWRMVVDTGDWDAAMMANTPGQSGDPRSPFYGDLLETWAKDESVPLLYSRSAIEAATVVEIRLRPR